jgi:dihydroorotate dehydrogenase
MFRLTEDKGVINRYGFNSLGAVAVEDNLDKATQVLDARRAARAGEVGKDGATTERRAGGVVGVNLGKNKTSADAEGDYADGLKRLSRYVWLWRVGWCWADEAGPRGGAVRLDRVRQGRGAVPCRLTW